MSISKEAYQSLESIVGSAFISDDPGVCESYRKGGYGKNRPALEGQALKPACVILPGSTEEVRQILKVCNQYKIPFIPIGCFGITTQAPKVPDVVSIDLKRMDYLEIDEKNMYAICGPGVIYAQLQAEALKLGLATEGPGCGVGATVIGNHLNAGVGPLEYRMGWAQRRMLGVEWVLPDGDIVTLGSTALDDEDYFWGEGLGPDLRGVLRGTFGWQGGLGIVTKMATKLFPFPGQELERTGISPQTGFNLPPHLIKWINVFYPSIEEAAHAMHELSKAQVGMALMTAPFTWRYFSKAESKEAFHQRWHADLPKLEKDNPHMMRIMLVGLAGTRQLEYEERVVRDVIERVGGDLHEGRPFDESWINNADAHRIMFPGGAETSMKFHFDSLDASMELAKAAAELKKKYTPPLIADYGIPGWLQMGDFGHVAFCEILVYFDPTTDPNDCYQHEVGFVESVRQDLELRAYCGLQGSYGPEAQIIGPAYGNYHLKEKELQEVFDPNGISNPPRPLDYAYGIDLKIDLSPMDKYKKKKAKK